MGTNRFFFICLSLFIAHSLCAQFGVQGSAERFDTDCFRLTRDSVQSNGKIISNRVIDLTEPVTLYTELFFGNENEGGDGIAFFFQRDNQVVTSTNPTFGLGMNQPSIVVEIDTFQDTVSNVTNNDPDFDHIALSRDGDFNHSSINNLQGPVIANAGGDIEDGNWHAVKIDWQPLTNTLTVLFDCEERINFQIDLINDVFEGNPDVFYGFSASTSQAQNQQEVCVVVNTLTDRLQDVVLCQGGKTQINAVRGGERYNWTPTEGLAFENSPNPVGTPDSDIVYSLEIETGYCDEVLNYEISIDVHEIPGPREFIIEDTTLCLDDVLTIDATIDPIRYNATNYLWSTMLNEPIESFNRNGRYDVTVTIDDMCIVEDWVRLAFETEGPDVQLGPDTTVCQRSAGFFLRPLEEIENVSFLWSNGSTADSIIVNRGGLFSLQVSNDCGASIDDIFVSTEDCQNFYMPNVFSPNLDGLNDLIFPFTEEQDVSQITSYKIFNRWGVQVHSVENGIPNSPEIGWDGNFRNEPASPGVYVYEIILRFRDEQELLIKGDFTLLR